jgi:hypothetical protein
LNDAHAAAESLEGVAHAADEPDRVLHCERADLRRLALCSSMSGREEGARVVHEARGKLDPHDLHGVKLHVEEVAIDAWEQRLRARFGEQAIDLREVGRELLPRGLPGRVRDGQRAREHVAEHKQLRQRLTDPARGLLARDHALLSRGRGLRRLGAAALDLAYVAAGRFDGYWEFNLKPWDSAAGRLLVEEAGGRMSDFRGRPTTSADTSQTLASNGLLHPAMLALLRQMPASRV